MFEKILFYVTIKKAIKILDWWINQKKQGIQKLQEGWCDSGDVYGVGQTLLDAVQNSVMNVEKNCEKFTY